MCTVQWGTLHVCNCNGGVVNTDSTTKQLMISLKFSSKSSALSISMASIGLVQHGTGGGGLADPR